MSTNFQFHITNKILGSYMLIANENFHCKERCFSQEMKETDPPTKDVHEGLVEVPAEKAQDVISHKLVILGETYQIITSTCWQQKAHKASKPMSHGTISVFSCIILLSYMELL